MTRTKQCISPGLRFFQRKFSQEFHDLVRAEMKNNLKYNENSRCVTIVSDQERENIVLATKAQSNCQAWLITAS